MVKEKKLEDFLPNKKTSYFRDLNKKEDNFNLITEKEVVECIKTVMDPEIPVNLYDLGLIYSINIIKNSVIIE